MVHAPNDAHEYDDGSDEDGGPSRLILECEQSYITRKFGSLRAVGEHFGVPPSTLTYWSKKRDWVERRKTAERQAAKKLATSIDDLAAEEIASDFGLIRTNILKSAKLASQVVLAYHQRETMHIRKLLDSGERFSLPAKTIELLKIAERLADRLGDGHDDGAPAMDVDTLAERIAEIRARGEEESDLDDIVDIEPPKRLREAQETDR